MRPRTLARLGWLGISTILLRRDDPIVGSIILTDRCNLNCLHCAVANIRRVNYPMATIAADMASMYDRGARILFLYGGEPFLWRDGAQALPDVVAEARRIGYLLVNVVTNGTQGLDLPGVDVMMVSVDGSREHHDLIRGHTYDRILANIACAPTDNIVLYMAINNLNLDDIGHVCQTAVDLPNVRGAAFNFHTPYPGTEHLSLTRAQKRACALRIAQLKSQGYPVLDLASTFGFILEDSHPSPCRQCVIMEDGQEWVCGRCSEIPGLCQECGFLFSAELSLLFSGRPRVVLDAVRTYRHFL
jgi:MoaA/NifB/PqqE/SkfB family radical SAM enzyme